MEEILKAISLTIQDFEMDIDRMKLHPVIADLKEELESRVKLLGKAHDYLKVFYYLLQKTFPKDGVKRLKRKS